MIVEGSSRYTFRVAPIPYMEDPILFLIARHRRLEDGSGNVWKIITGEFLEGFFKGVDHVEGVVENGKPKQYVDRGSQQEFCIHADYKELR